MYQYVSKDKTQAKANTTATNKKHKPNNTGIPTKLKENFENFSGFSFDDVKVHYNSEKPAQLQALAYTQGNQVFIGAGQEKHLGHELGHVVQQKQGRVLPNKRYFGYEINCEKSLEYEASQFGNIANSYEAYSLGQATPSKKGAADSQIIQAVITTGQQNVVDQFWDKCHKKLIDWDNQVVINRMRSIIGLNKNVFLRYHNNRHMQTYLIDFLDRLIELGYHEPEQLRDTLKDEKGIPVRRIKGTNGTVTRDVVWQYLNEYHVNNVGIIQNALNQIAANQGGVGVRIFNPPVQHGAVTYFGELKIQVTDDRAYSVVPIPFVFDRIDVHL